MPTLDTMPTERNSIVMRKKIGGNQAELAYAYRLERFQRISMLNLLFWSLALLISLFAIWW